MRADGSSAVVADVEAVSTSEPVPVYDLTVEGVHTFLVGHQPDSAVVVHNCSEYMSARQQLSCNLASINLLTFLQRRQIRRGDLRQRVELVITAMDISICFADFPTESIGDTTRKYRQLGIGYANLGALLMASGLGYDSDGGRALAAAITT